VTPELFVQPPQSRFAIGCAVIFFGPFIVGFSMSAYKELGPPFVAIPVVLGIALFIFIYWIFAEEIRVTIDDQKMRYSLVRVVLGIRTAERVKWEIPIRELTQAREVTTRTPSQHGGWSKRTVLHLSGQTIEATLLGGNEQSNSTYLALVTYLKSRLGNAFTHEDVV
jgi:hypothetical protein